MSNKRRNSWLPLSVMGLFSLLLYVVPVFALAPSSDFAVQEDVVVPLTPDEVLSLQPRYKSVEDFWNHQEEWEKTRPGAKLFYIVRHGESTSNIMDFTRFFSTYSPLTRLGRIQARLMAKFLKRLGFTRFVASDSERAYMTLRELATAKGAEKPLKADKRLREVPHWYAGGMELEEAAKAFEKERYKFRDDPDNFVVPGLGSLPEYRAGIHSLLNELICGEDKQIALGTHGFTIIYLLMDMFNINLKKTAAAKTQLGNSPNTGITITAFDPNTRKWELLVYKDNSYLAKELRGKSENRWGLRADHYIRAMVRLLFDRLIKRYPDLADFIPGSETFFWPAPADIKSRIKASEIVDTSQ